MTANPRALAKGVVSLIVPGATHIRHDRRSAAYFYSALMRHLVRLDAHGARPRLGAVAELGPGAALGMGLTALLLGADSYRGLDIAPYGGDPAANRALLDALAGLIAERAEIPHGGDCARVRPSLADHRFPDWLGTDAASVRDRAGKLAEVTPGTPPLLYTAPWTNRADRAQPEPPSDRDWARESALGSNDAEAGTLDWLFSQAVLEHVDDVPATWAAIARWLAPGGVTSHQVDLRSHGTATTWNGHWAIPALTWKLIRGRRPYLLNRQPLSAHLRALEAAGLELIAVDRAPAPDPGTPRAKLQAPWRSLSEEDLTTAGAFIVARRPG